MHFNVRHTTVYRYSDTVPLGPHVIRLRPRYGAGLHVSRWSMQILPEPVGHTEMIDASGSLADLVWFGAPASELTIVTQFEARTAPANPFGYIVTEPGALRLPARYAEHNPLLAPYRKPEGRSGPVVRLAAKLARKADGNTQQFLAELASHLAGFEKVIRESGAPKPPGQTLAERSGACRDLTVLFMEVCRCQGLAARFVSGYWRGSKPGERKYLHAWAEVFLPGAGWRGYDPSIGLAVGDGHVPVASAPDSSGASPIAGSFGGHNVRARMEWTIRIEVR